VKKKLPVPLIALGAAAGVLLIAVFILLSKSSSESSRANQLSDTVVKIATTLGSTNITPEVLADSEAAQGALDSLVVAVTGQGENLKAVQAENETAKATAVKVQGELTAATEASADAQGKLDSISRDLSTRSAELQTLQKKYDSDVAALNTEIADMKSAQAAQAAATAASVEAAATANTEGDAEAVVVVDASSGDKSVTLPPGGSHYFKSYSYTAANSNLTLQAIKGGKLTFSEVPATAVDELAAAAIFDVYFRFQLMDKYPSVPKDRDFMKGLK